MESFFHLMENEGWILRLPSDAHETHACVLSPSQDEPVKRTHDDSRGNPKPEKEDRVKDLYDGESSKRRRISQSAGLLRGRPILRDVFNDIIDLT